MLCCKLCRSSICQSLIGKTELGFLVFPAEMFSYYFQKGYLLLTQVIFALIQINLKWRVHFVAAFSEIFLPCMSTQ